MATPLQQVSEQAGVRYDMLGVDEGAGTLNVAALEKLAANKQPTSSVGPVLKKQADMAISRAASELVTTPVDPIAQQRSLLQQQFLQDSRQTMDENEQMFDRMRKATELSYDTQLASINSQYANLHQQLEEDKNKALDIAVAQAQSLNPYASARGATTSQSFQNAIVDRYATQARKLQEAADLAQQQLAAGRANAYLEIMNSMTRANQQFRSEMSSFIQQQLKAEQEQQQFTAQERRYAVDDYSASLSKNLPAPEELQKMSLQEILKLTPFELGSRAGFDLESILNDVLAASSAQAQEQEREDTKFSLDTLYRRKQIENLDSTIQRRNSTPIGGDDDLFTRTQLNTASARAGLSIQEFEGLPDDIKNFYVSDGKRSQLLNEALAAISNGSVDPQTVKENIDTWQLAPDVSRYLKGLVDEVTPEGVAADQVGLWGRMWDNIYAALQDRGFE